MCLIGPLDLRHRFALARDSVAGLFFVATDDCDTIGAISSSFHYTANVEEAAAIGTKIHALSRYVLRACR